VPVIAVAVLVVLTVFTSYLVVGPLRTWWRKAQGSVANVTTPRGNAPPGTVSGDLEQKHDVALTGAGDIAVAVAGDTAYYAAVTTKGVEVAALPAAGGERKWTTTVEVKPTDVRVSVVAGLVVVDAERVASDKNNDHRAVLDGTGKLLWEREWDGRRDLAYIGNHALIERTGDFNPAVIRADLSTGKDVWSRPGAKDLLINDMRLAHAARWWPDKAPAADVVAPLTDDAFAESLVAGTDVVMLDEGAAKGYVIDGTTGKEKATGALPLDNEKWTVYGGLVIGVQKDGTNVVAYRTSDLGKAWEIEYVTGTDIMLIRGCGPTLVCVAAEAPGASDPVVAAYELADRAEKWKHPANDDVTEAGWYVVGGKMIFGSGTFHRIQGGVILDPAKGPNDRRALGRFTMVLTGQGGRYLTQQYAGTEWTVGVGEVGSDKVTKVAKVGKDQPLSVALVGEVVAVAMSDHHVRVYRVTAT